jgi:hypothetical protein
MPDSNFSKQFPVDVRMGTDVNIGAHMGKEWIKQNVLNDLLDEFEHILQEYVPTQYDGVINVDYVRIKDKINSLRKF